MKRISNNSTGAIMDLDVPIRLGNDSPFIVKFYGAIDAEVKRLYCILLH